MSDSRKTPKNEEQDKSSMHVDVRHISAGGNVVFAGRDANIKVNTGGDVDHQTTTTITVGGVSTSQQEFDQLVLALQQLEDSITSTNLDAETLEEAAFHREAVETQLTSEKAPNGKILVHAARRLYKMSPAIAGAIISVFSEPLVGQIVMTAGGIAQRFYEALLSQQQ